MIDIGLCSYHLGKELYSLKDRVTHHWRGYEPFYIQLGDKKVADIVITNHAKTRWHDRVEPGDATVESIGTYLWDMLKSDEIEPYYRREEDVYLVEGDLVVVAEFIEIEGEYDMSGAPLHRMIIVTFLGRMSETIELRDLKSYYSWLRHSRRMTLIKNNRKHK